MISRRFTRISFLMLTLSSLPALASEEGLNFYALFLGLFGLETKWVSLAGSLLAFFFLCLLGLIYQRKVESALAKGDYTPAAGISVVFFVEMLADFVYSIAKEQCGHYYKTLAPVLLGLFLYILLNNLSGLLPGLPPATESFNNNLALGLMVFLLYNYFGFKEHGFHYLKQFMGPSLAIAPLFFCLELISHSIRPFSLGFRLLANIFGDHLVLSVFSSIVPFVVPALLLFFGLLVASIQSFVFTILTAIYINMAISHDH